MNLSSHHCKAWECPTFRMQCTKQVQFPNCVYVVGIKQEIRESDLKMKFVRGKQHDLNNEHHRMCIPRSVMPTRLYPIETSTDRLSCSCTECTTATVFLFGGELPKDGSTMCDISCAKLDSES